MQTTDDLSNGLIFPKGREADRNHFTGLAWSEALVSDTGAINTMIYNVTFAPGARNNWHRHPGAQVLLVTGGRGYYQEEGQPARELQPGDVVRILPGVKHWHGAAPTSWFAHLAINLGARLGGAEWLEPLPEEEYSRLK